MNILIVEDQEDPLAALEDAVKKVVPKFASRYSYDKARCYWDASKLINTNRYDLILLDHRMPMEAVDLRFENSEFESRYFKTLRNVGYRLIPTINALQSNAILIGTSSLDSSELKDFSHPTYQMSKMYGEAAPELEKILKIEQEKKGEQL